MLSINWPEVIAKSKKGSNIAFNRAVADNYAAHFKGPIISLTSNEEDAYEIYLEVMTKFWERFVLQTEDLPKQNINGYIFRMIRNKFVDESRKKKSLKNTHVVELDPKKLIYQLKDSAMLYDESHPTNEHKNKQESESKHLIALENAISKLCEDCKQLIERNIFDGERLKVLKTELGYTGSYQTIVEKKKRCIKKMTKLFFIELANQELSQ